MSGSSGGWVLGWLLLAGIARASSYERCPEPLTGGPERLSQTGLFAGPEALGEGVVPFRPRYELWSDGASKRRWIRLPPGARIDTEDMDAWDFPVGTRLWKEFSADGIRVETRMLERIGPAPEDWLAISYLWDPAGIDASAAPEGARDALGTAHDVPSARQCAGCHGGTASRVLGFSAVQLPLEAPEGQMSLSRLASLGLLTRPPARPYDPPGDPAAADALGYLHANCAHCHNQRRPDSEGPRCYDPRRRFDLSLRTDQLSSVGATPAYRTAIGRVLSPGRPEASGIYRRVRGDLSAFQARMPPLATEIPDPRALPLLAGWIAALPEAHGAAPEAEVGR